MMGGANAGLKRSATIFVKNVSAERRKNILKVRYHSDDASGFHHILDYLRVILSLVGCVIVLGTSLDFEVKHNAYLPAAPGAYWSCAGFACLTGAGMYELLRYRHYKQVAVSVSGSLNVASFICLCVCFALKDPRPNARGVDIVGLVAAGLTLAHAITFNIAYRTFAGLYAPLVPSTHAPTVLPVSGLYTIGSAALVTALALALVGRGPREVNGFVEAQKGCQVGAFVAWTAAAWGELGVVFVSSKNAKRRRVQRDQTEAAQIQERKLLETPNTTAYPRAD
eukprot:Gregarina_sp_Pseudo_9__34@NODE_1023_length_1963_cov_58_005717_g959_i0_p1_GENE_NODE_1023_length_1963_cov_58_005717_g959_i0NODE_1023_length_1963_cov_58_005717_g959_i0_p1_ORF_typecomplete_len281_score52_07MASE3/PF17159_4/0_036_NODE_1023_length_1963_cov_58_005717_g959_i05711413